MSKDRIELEHITLQCWRVAGESIMVLYHGDGEYLVLWIAENRLESFPSLKELRAAIERKLI